MNTRRSTAPVRAIIVGLRLNEQPQNQPCTVSKSQAAIRSEPKAPTMEMETTTTPTKPQFGREKETPNLVKHSKVCQTYKGLTGILEKI